MVSEEELGLQKSHVLPSDTIVFFNGLSEVVLSTASVENRVFRGITLLGASQIPTSINYIVSVLNVTPWLIQQAAGYRIVLYITTFQRIFNFYNYIK